MSSEIPLKSVDDIDAFSQKCIVPINILKCTDLKVGDFFFVKCRCTSFICRISLLTNLENSIAIDDSVSLSINCCQFHHNFENEFLHFPDAFSPLNISVFENIEVKLVLQDDEDIIPLVREFYADIVRKILISYVFGKHTTIKCHGFSLADMFHIHSIIICETFNENNVFGRLSRSAVVEISQISTVEQIKQKNKFNNFVLGGAKNIIKLLELNSLVSKQNFSRRILITGPSGCGKSTLVKKFCCDNNSFFILIDGIKVCNLSVENTSKYYNSIIYSLKTFPTRPCILFIDHIEQFSSSKKNQFHKNLKSVSGVVYLIEHLKFSNVLVIAATVHKNFLHSSVLRLFHEEITCGMPSFEERKEILEVLTECIPNKEIDYDEIAAMTPGFIARDITLLVKEAIMKKKNKCAQNADLETLSTKDFINATISLSPSVLKVSQWNLKVKPIHWKDIGGMKKIKERLQMCIERPLRHPEVFKKVDFPRPRGVLLFGPPGCCKTTLARGLATECNANFFAASPAQIYSPYVGESEKNISELFSQARLCAPSIIFLDELDSLVGCRQFLTKTQNIGEKVLSVLLNEMDGFGARSKFARSSSNLKDKMMAHCSDEVIVVAATNRPDLIDDALLRPGRFDVILFVPPPDTEEREEILQTITENVPIKDINLKTIAQKTEYFSGADLKNLYQKAALNALRRDISAKFITEENFVDVLKSMQPSITRQQIEMYERLASKYGPLTTR